ncbi:MAG: Asp-tRNA(Asn)/Glu-tRNA(Gln) amidotransferase GatCAB subunit B [Pelagibacteraceae bacterium]|nr:Asp-tRNA(Asn)/Glu-tRNA(Gln) amidotransferase GatCAB subunit B [Pelagibacteraceae bacterium]
MVMGLEVHAQLKTESKLFSSSPNQFGSDPNNNVNYIDAGMPGMLPVMNSGCIDKAIKTGFALNFKINPYSVFERKNYFYADLPQGYQISQFEYPILTEGFVEIESENSLKKIRLERAHLEQDAGKSIHDIDPKYSFIDLNRVGTPLLEIVSYPDFSSADEVINYLTNLRQILMYIDVCDGNMQEGSLRADINLSVKKPNSKLGTRCEIKNMNSFKFIRQAIEYESKRQIEVLESGNKIEQNTLLFDTSTGETRPMRSKEFAHDYRYFPDPDLLPINISQDQIEKAKMKIGELPNQKLTKFIDDLGLEKDIAKIIISEKQYAEFFEGLISTKLIKAKTAASWLVGDIFSFIKDKNIQINEILNKSQKIIELLQLVEKGTISSKVGKDILIEVLEKNKDPGLLVKELGLEQVSDNEELEKIVDESLSGEEENIQKFQSGSDRVLGYFVGKCLKATKGKGNPKIISDLLIKKIKK